VEAVADTARKAGVGRVIAGVEGIDMKGAVAVTAVETGRLATCVRTGEEWDSIGAFAGDWVHGELKAEVLGDGLRGAVAVAWVPRQKVVLCRNLRG
jgi:hypothetical protein